MTDTELTPALRAPAPEEIGIWLCEAISRYVDLPVEQIRPELSLSRSGLDSVYAFALSAEISDYLGLEVEPTLMWDLDTPAELTEYLAEAVHNAAGAESAASGSTAPDTAGR